MFNDTPDGTTMYCTHENKNEAGICPACMGTNPLLQLIDEQKLKDSLWCEALNRFEYTVKNRNIFDNDGYQQEIQYCCDQIINWHTSSIKDLLQKQVDMLKDEIINLDLDNGKDRWNNGYLMSLQKQINLLVETINSIK